MRLDEGDARPNTWAKPGRDIEVAIAETRGALYDAALRVIDWETALERVAALVDANSGNLGVPTFDPARGLLLDGYSWRFDIAEAAAVTLSVGECDPWSRVILDKDLRSPGTVLYGSELCEKARLPASPWWSRFMRHADTGDNIVFFFEAPKGAPGGVASLTLHRGIGQDPFDASDANVLLTLRDDIARAMRLSLLYNRNERQRRLSEAALDGLHDAVFVVGAEGAIHTMNAAAELLLQRGDFASASQGRLTSQGPGLARALNKALKEGQASDVVLRSPGGAATKARVAPLGGRAAQEANLSGPAAICVISTARAADAEMELRQLFGLTTSEASVAARLAAGQRVAEIARSRNVAPSTVRAQLKTIFAKLGVGSQVEAAALLASLRLSFAALATLPL